VSYFLGFKCQRDLTIVNVRSDVILSRNQHFRFDRSPPLYDRRFGRPYEGPSSKLGFRRRF
jgi:hypothetical protein